MAKSVTVKDVLYALQFGGERLARSRAGVFSLSPSGTLIPRRIADEARATGQVMLAEHHLDGRELYGWRSVA
jgi:hypothetical protein